MTNNPPLNADALGKAIEVYDDAFDNAWGVTYEGLKAGIAAYLAALPAAGEVDEARFQAAITWLGPVDDEFNQWHLEEGTLRAFAARLSVHPSPASAEVVDGDN